jgi:folate-binding protein YgfZ
MFSPLHDRHATLGAALGALDGVELPARYTDLDVEVAAARRGAGLVDLAHIRQLTLSSPDVKRWANGMFTNNIRKLQPGQGSRSACCDDRGRVQGTLDLYCTADDEVIVLLDGVDDAWFAQRYKMFMILDEIELDVAEQAPWLISLQGPEATSLLSAAGLPVPEADHDHIHTGSARVARKDRTGLGGFDILCDDDETAQKLWDALTAAGASPLGHDALDALRILAGRARWPKDGTEKSMVHELLLNKEVCAFDKGCYVGQEVINRIDVKGGIQKRLTALRLDGPVPLGAVAWLNDRKLGALTSTAAIAGVTYGLAVLRKQAWEEGTTVELRTEDGATHAATVITPPLAGT